MKSFKHLLAIAIAIALLPSAVLAQQFTPQQMLDVMTKSPSNRDVRVHDSSLPLTCGWNSGINFAPANVPCMGFPPGNPHLPASITGK